MTILHSIIVIAGSVGFTTIMGFIFKWVNSGKLKSANRKIDTLSSQNEILQKQNSSLQNKINQIERERAAGASLEERSINTDSKTKDLLNKASKAKAEPEIMDIMNKMDKDNNAK
jgi:hypothetical protein